MDYISFYKLAEETIIPRITCWSCGGKARYQCSCGQEHPCIECHGRGYTRYDSESWRRLDEKMKAWVEESRGNMESDWDVPRESGGSMRDDN